MKFFLILAITIVFSINLINAKPKEKAMEVGPEVKAAIQLCRPKFNITENDLKMMAGKSKSKDVSHNYQCFVDCMGNELGLVKDGKIQDDKVISDMIQKSHQTITNDDATKIVNTCKTEVAKLNSNDNCVNSYTFKECTKSNAIKLFMSKAGKKGGKN